MKQQIEPAYATFEQGKKLKEKGFDLECNSFYNFHKPQINGLRGLVTPREHNSGIYQDHNGETEDDDLICSAPEQWQIVEWLRVNHGIHIEVSCDVYGELWYANLFVCSKEVWEDEDKCHNILTAHHKFNNEHKSKKEAYSAAFDYILNELI